MRNQNARGRKQGAGALADFAKRVAMALAALAFSAGLYAQIGLNFGSSLAAGVSLFAMMALAHAAYARARANALALNELAGATAEMERFSEMAGAMEQFAGSAYRIDELAARLEEIEERISSAPEAEGALSANQAAQLDRLSAEVDRVNSRLEAVRNELRFEAREGREKIAAEMEVLENLVRQIASHMLTRQRDREREPVAEPRPAPQPEAKAPPHDAFGYRQPEPEPERAEARGHQPIRHDPPRVMPEPQLPEDGPTITWRVEPASAPAPEPRREERRPVMREPEPQSQSQPTHSAYEAPRGEPAPPRRQEPPRVEPTPPIDTRALDAAILEAVRRSVEANKVDLYLQPIVTLPQRQVRYYEALTRLRDGAGEVLVPDDYLRIAEDAGMMPLIDNVMLYRSVQVLRRLSERANARGVFCNISVHSLLDADFFPEFIAFMEQNQSLADSLHFEFSQAMIEQCGAIEFESLGALAALGFRFSLDRVTNLNMDFQRLHERGFRFVKISGDVLLNRMAEAGARIHAADMRAYLERHGLQLIVEKVEDERSLAELLDYDVGLGQGYLFSEPRPVRPEVFGPADTAAAAA